MLRVYLPELYMEADFIAAITLSLLSSIPDSETYLDSLQPPKLSGAGA